jgi:hypothetical protein
MMGELLLSTVASAIHTATERTQDQKDFYEIYKVIAPTVNLCDRTGHVTTPYNYKVMLPIPEEQTNVGTFSEISIARGIELLNLSKTTNKPCLILWSGGIDSTSLLTAMIIASEGDYSNLKICMNAQSIRENPRFYYTYIRGKIEIIASETMFSHINKDHIVISGEGCDQLFGTDIYQAIERWDNGRGAMFQPYNFENVGAFFMYKGMSERAAKIWYDIMDDQIKAKQPCEIIDFKDFFWWYNFCYKWQNVYYRLFNMGKFMSFPLDQDFFDNNYIQFFMNDDFQRWSIANPDKKITKDWSTYKFTAKEFIFDFTKDQEYLDNKVKIASLINVFRTIEHVGALNSNYEFLPPHFDITPYKLQTNSFS